MIKPYHILNTLTRRIEEATEAVADDVIRMHGELAAREEEITAQIRSEITLHLMERLKEKIDEKHLHGMFFNVYTFTKKQESKIGADLAGIVQITMDDHTIKKGFLAQAKVALHSERDRRHRIGASVRNKDILKQTKLMRKITQQSYIFLYTEFGVQVVSTANITENKIDTDDHYYLSLGDFYGNICKCFAGDTQLAEIYNQPSDLQKLATEIGAKNIIAITARDSGFGTAM